MEIGIGRQIEMIDVYPHVARGEIDRWTMRIDGVCVDFHVYSMGIGLITGGKESFILMNTHQLTRYEIITALYGEDTVVC